ncbi:MAG: OmpA family protein [Thermodesulfobacteriota bacterium]|nr:OmpA family protein [Thermodesulfobacteriota bacterium]
MYIKKGLVFFILVSFIAAGCAGTREIVKERKKTTIGAVAGAVTGAGVGYAAGKGKGAAIGAVVGAIAGGSIGHMMDKQEREFREALAASESASIQRVKEAEQEAIILTFKSDTLFGFDSAIIKPEFYSEIDRVASILNRYSQTNIRIEGHTDSTGDETYNLKLSERRADAVKNALVAKGVDTARITIVALGESKPVASNDTTEGRQQNRRVSIIVVPVQT